jgi:uncharacterized protein YdhG (YjbR/CyaY superfamily)
MKRSERTSERAERPDSIDEYIAGFPPRVRPILERVRRTIRRAAPGAEEHISYQMPAFRLEGMGIVAWFGGFKEHVGLYPPVRDLALQRATARYAGPKGNLRFRFDEPIPHALIERIVKARLRANAGASPKASAASKSKSKSKSKPEPRSGPGPGPKARPKSAARPKTAARQR